ncbi:MAG: YceI family protein [Ignavibacteria bacterium]|nr:YceI family protein [Ignavibacteria bacterium]NCS81278.1 YceI family protein [Ignavibacteria bacterium]PIS46373.1 MAG: hypothetical protein COT22_00320 [Ignavibacteria bacterium CG08_land_8_20_14_0_20_37_9]PIX94534.1 MAG: hypothetical protein COZ25_05075 [Ignavibacteria bacterium CG_4_10_14_3_um_filter_37_18]PJC60295.1 MAG: hypothetical protein CO025_03600 [Ignavibacteria bacterium CG_4_9_14_0_2_um_filter_37_13]
MRKILFVCLLISVEFFSQGTELHVKQGSKNHVEFISDAPFGKFSGVTENIDGYMYWEGNNYTTNSSLYFEVDLKTLDTGIGLRNRHMRDNYLQTDKFPDASFKGKITNVTPAAQGPFKVDADGEMFIHGVTKYIKISGVLTKSGNSDYNLKTNFSIKLSSYNIDIPSIMMVKLSEVIELQLNFNLFSVNKAEGKK